MALMDRIDACALYKVDEYVDFCVGMERLGGIARQALGPLKEFPGTLLYKDDQITLNPKFDSWSPPGEEPHCPKVNSIILLNLV